MNKSNLQEFASRRSRDDGKLDRRRPGLSPNPKTIVGWARTGADPENPGFSLGDGADHGLSTNWRM
jgi:hypothetical protein